MTRESQDHRPDPLSLRPQKDTEQVQQIAELIRFHRGEQWGILHLTRYEHHWVVVGYQGGLVRDFLLEQTPDAQFVYHVAEKTIYPLTQSVWRYSTGTDEPLELTTYVVQYGGNQCNECTITTAFTQAALYHYLLNGMNWEQMSC